MKTLALQGGDLIVGPRGHRTITAGPKIRQDLALALGEEVGTDRFHPDWGSVLPRYVGRPIGPETELMVRSEVARVVQLYIDTQRNEIVNDALAGRRSRFTTADVVSRLDKIDTVLRYDAILVRLSLVTRSHEGIIITRTVATP